jgi:chromosomal replication initiator protein
MPALSAAEAWSRSLHIVKDNIPDQSFKTWFEPIRPMLLDTHVLTIQVPSQFFAEWIEERYIDLLSKAIRHVIGPQAKLVYSVVMENGLGPNKVTMQLPAAQAAFRAENPSVNQPVQTGKSVPNPFIIPGLKQVTISPNLNPAYNFDSYVGGDYNELARTAGFAVASNPGGTAYNPLLIYGKSGLGKTHLVQAIGNDIKQRFPNKVVMYVTADRFINQFVDSIRNASTADFVALYHLVDVLILDDVQQFANKEKTIEIFFKLFNELHANNKQIILTSDCAPSDLKGLDERLLSRFGMPNYETRRAILDKKMYQQGIVMPLDVIDYIAHHVDTSVRELEGALISLLAHSTLTLKPITLELASQVVRNLIQNTSRELSIDSIQRTVSDYFRLSVEKLKEKTRKREIVQARQI